MGERWTDGSATGILIASVPLLIALVQRFFGISERLGGWRIAGLLLGFLGVVALVGARPMAGVYVWVGVACMILAATGYAIGPLIIQPYMHGFDSLGALAASLRVAAVALLVPAASEMPAQRPSSVAVLSIIVLGVICTGLAMLLMFYLVRQAGASRATVITHINPRVATLLGVVLDERIGIGGAAAFAFILLARGSWLAKRGAPATP